MSHHAHLLGPAVSVVPIWANGVKDFLTLEVEAVGDDDVAVRQRERPPGCRPDGRLQAGAGPLQDGSGHGALVQVHVLGDGVDNDVGLGTIRRSN